MSPVHLNPKAPPKLDQTWDPITHFEEGGEERPGCFEYAAGNDIIMWLGCLGIVRLLTADAVSYSRLLGGE